MKSKKVTFSLNILDSVHEIHDESERKLCLSAQNAINHAYAPYSKYKVGAAVLMANNEIVEGSNQENAVYPLGLCAERVALFSASVLYPDIPIKAIAIKTIKKLKQGEMPGFPCGSCRQTIIDMENRHKKNIRVYVLGDQGPVYFTNSAKDLLPFAFGDSDL